MANDERDHLTNFELQAVPLLQKQGLEHDQGRIAGAPRGGMIQVDGEKVTETSLALVAGKTYLLKVGKRRFKRVTLKL